MPAIDPTAFTTLKTAPQVLLDQLPALGDRPRFHVADGPDWRPVTWRDLADQMRRTALALVDLGLQPGERAAIFAPNSVPWFAAALGIQASGGAMVPIYASCTAAEAGYVLGHSDAAVVFVDTAALLERVLLASTWGGLRAVVLLADVDVQAVAAAARGRGLAIADDAAIEAKALTWQAIQARGAALDVAGAFEARLAGVQLADTAVMLYTSGTSGPPKGVPLTHANIGINGRDWLLCNAPLLDAADAQRNGMVDVLWLPMSHIFGFGEACLGNTLGFETWLCEPAAVVGLLPQVQPSVFMSVPSLWEKFAIAARAKGDGDAPARLAAMTGGRLKFCLSGGAGLPKTVKEFFHSCGVLILEGYGLTETSPTLTLNRPGAFRFDSVGRALPSVELRLADDGEIQARGPTVFSGYHKDPAATAAAFTDDGWFCTGDVGRFTDDGFLQIIDRKKDILVTAGGKNVAPANIELRFRDDPFVAQVVVYGDARSYLVAGVWLHEAATEAWLQTGLHAGEPRDQGLRRLVQGRIDAVNAELARHETLKNFAVLGSALTVESGFLTPTMKVKRKAVVQTFGDRLADLYEGEAKSTAAMHPNPVPAAT